MSQAMAPPTERGHLTAGLLPCGRYAAADRFHRNSLACRVRRPSAANMTATPRAAWHPRRSSRDDRSFYQRRNLAQAIDRVVRAHRMGSKDRLKRRVIPLSFGLSSPLRSGTTGAPASL